MYRIYYSTLHSFNNGSHQLFIGDDNMRITPVQRIQGYETKLEHDIDGDQVYDTRTGKTIEDIDFSEILKKELEDKQ